MPRITHNDRTPKVLFVADFPGVPRVSRMASALSESGSSVSLLEWDRSGQLPLMGYYNDIKIYRMKLHASYGFKMFIKLPIWWAYISLFLVFHDFDVIQPQNLDNLLPIWPICRIKRQKIVYDLADFYSDAYIPAKMNVIRNAVSGLERTFLRTVDATILPDEQRKEQVRMYGSLFSIIYNTPPDILYRMRPCLVFDRSEEYATKRVPSSRFRILYAGIIQEDRGLNGLVKCVKEMDDVELLVAGFGSMEKEFSALVRDAENVTYFGRVSHSAVLRLTLSAQCVVALYDPSFPNNVFASPNKLFESMMCAKPIIVSDGTAMADRVRNEKCGMIVRHDNVLELRKAIETIKNDSNLALALGRNGRRAYLERFSWNLMRERFLELYSSLLS